MDVQYKHIRAEEALSFNIDDFKEALEALTDFRDQIDFWNKYFDVPAMGRNLSIDIDYKIIFHFYCESDECRKNFTYERQRIFINWRKDYFKPLQITFDKLHAYEERIDFCMQHFGFALSKYVPEEGVVFNTLPNNPDEWKLYNRLSYEEWEKNWLNNHLLENKSFEIRKKMFTDRIVNHLYPDRGLQDEIDSIYNEYFMPNVKINQNSEHTNIHVIIFRERYNGYMIDYADKRDTIDSPIKMVKYIEGEHAYKYYRFLVELQREPNWLKKLKREMYPETNYTISVDFGKSYESQYFNREIKEDGFVYIGSRNKIYSGPLAAFLQADEIDVKEQFTQVIKTIRGRDYINSYQAGYEKGKVWFKDNYGLTVDSLYGKNAEVYVANIHDLCFHFNFGTWPEGLFSWKGQFPLLINNRVIEEHGYYAGIISQVEELTIKHPKLFKNWDKCNYDDQIGNTQISSDSIENSDKLLNFCDLLINEKKEQIVALLALHYANRKARFITYMIFALSDLGIMSQSVLDDKTKLHTALKNSFGDIGTRTALNEAIIRLNAPTKKQRTELQEHKEKIAVILQPVFLT